MHKSRIVLVSLALVLMLALLIPLVGCGGGEAVPCKVSSVSGDVQVLKSGSTESVKATNGMELAVGDTITTGSNGSAKLTFFDGSVMEIKANSEILINELSTATSGSTSVSLMEQVGSTVNRIGKLVDSSSKYEVETPAAVAVVRGTTFDLVVEEDGETTVKSEEGSVDFTAAGVTVTVNKGYQSSASVGEAPSTPSAIVTTTPTAAATSTSTSTSGQTLGDIYGVGRDIGDVKFDMVMTSPEMTEQLVEKVYYKDAWLTDKMKIRYEMPAVVEGAFSTIFIMDLGANVEYMWYPDQNIACQLPAGEGSDNPVEDVEIIPVKVGTETIDGKLCDVYQWTSENISMKEWVWKEKSFPIRAEVTSLGETTVIEYKNIVFGSLSDSLFTVPSSVQMQPYPCYPSFSFPST
jgi:hypothetical protein